MKLLTFIYQESNWQRRAAPLLVQCSGVKSVFRSKKVTKLVECPVVLNSPFLRLVLYKGHS